MDGSPPATAAQNTTNFRPQQESTGSPWSKMEPEAARNSPPTIECTVLFRNFGGYRGAGERLCIPTSRGSRLDNPHFPFVLPYHFLESATLFFRFLFALLSLPFLFFFPKSRSILLSVLMWGEASPRIWNVQRRKNPSKNYSIATGEEGGRGHGGSQLM